MARKRYSRPIDILAAAAAADDHVENHTSEHRSGSESEVNKLSGSDPDSMVIPKPSENDSPRSKSSRIRSVPKHLLLNEFNDSNKKARVDKSSGSGSVNRLWCEQDEVAILQGMIDFKLRKGEDPYSDTNAFLEFVQDSISFHVSRKQMTDKMRRLKNKYFVNVERGGVENGVVVKPHDVQLFELSEVIWGGDGTKDKEDENVVEDGKGDDMEGGNVVENGNDDVAENGIEGDHVEGGNVVENGKVDVAENGVEGDDVEGGNVVKNGVNGNVEYDGKEDGGKDFKGMYPYLSRAWESDASCSMLMKSFLVDNIRMIGNAELSELEKNWKNLYVDQLKLYVKRLDLEKASAQALLAHLETSDS
ncbi:STOREKEEPER protein-like [Apium graveolens]|uniref:STOREKEEPER protein-like n=1 Tax=Apium graveolens TaxID=4045 RepID=UPI003D7C046E